MANVYYQPDFKDDATLITPKGVELWSYYVYQHKKNAQRDFPDREILEYTEDDIEYPVFMDDCEEEFLDWIVAMDFAHYETEEFGDYKPTGPSHWYLKGSPERFTSKELIDIYNNTMSESLRERWLWAIPDKKK